jgi:tetratricopeptide (TPR) repeat protein
MAEGNAAARAYDFAAALEHYDNLRRSAGDSPLLAFNSGVAQYRLRKFDAAEASFARASQDARLAPRAFYNLGLVHRAQGHSREARIWFQRAQDHPGASSKLRALASRASRGSAATPRQARHIPKEFGRDPERAIDFFDFGLDTKFASDSNIYRAPSSPYTDLADPAAPTVDPDVQSGTYVPVTAWLQAEWGRWDYSRFHLGYQFAGDFYTDSAFSNANRHSHVIRLDNVYDRKTRFGRIYLSSAVTAARYDEEAFDRDDGTSQQVLGEDVSDRLAYDHFGPRLHFVHDIGRFRYGLELAAEVNQYDSTLAAVDYSHHQFSGGVEVSYRILDGTRLGFDGDYAQRVYEVFPARERDGTRFTLNPALEYRYLGVGTTLRQRITRFAWIGLEYRITDREDQYRGYDDFRRQSLRAVAHLDVPRLSVDLAYVHRDYDFANAFAFDVPTGGDKTLTSSAAELDLDYRLWRDFYITAHGRLRIVDSSDARLEYEQTQLAVGMKWSM